MRQLQPEDEEVVARWVRNPYGQYCCGFDYLPLELAIDPSSLVRWWQRIGQDGIELLLHETIAAAERSEAVKPQSLARVSVDTTVQTKAMAHPSDSRLYHRGREIRIRLARRHGVPLRQSYVRLGKKALRLASRYAHARQMKRAQREIKRLQTYFGRVFRDVRRKLEAQPELTERFIRPLALVERLLAQQAVERDRHGRIVAKVFSPDGVDIGRKLVSAGWALAYRRYSKDYVDAEDEARKARRGMWRGTFVKPWVWRISSPPRRGQGFVLVTRSSRERAT